MEVEKVEQVKNGNKTEKGASLVEYALLVALIAIIAIMAIRTLGNTISNQFSSLSNQISG